MPKEPPPVPEAPSKAAPILVTSTPPVLPPSPSQVSPKTSPERPWGPADRAYFHLDEQASAAERDAKALRAKYDRAVKLGQDDVANDIAVDLQIRELIALGLRDGANAVKALTTPKG